MIRAVTSLRTLPRIRTNMAVFCSDYGLSWPLRGFATVLCSFPFRLSCSKILNEAIIMTVVIYIDCRQWIINVVYRMCLSMSIYMYSASACGQISTSLYKYAGKLIWVSLCGWSRAVRMCTWCDLMSSYIYFMFTCCLYCIVECVNWR